jgi:hypothetical protein
MPRVKLVDTEVTRIGLGTNRLRRAPDVVSVGVPAPVHGGPVVPEPVSLGEVVLEPDHVVLGGCDAKKLEELPENVRLGADHNAFVGASRLWDQT